MQDLLDTVCLDAHGCDYLDAHGKYNTTTFRTVFEGGVYSSSTRLIPRTLAR